MATVEGCLEEAEEAGAGRFPRRREELAGRDARGACAGATCGDRPTAADGERDRAKTTMTWRVPRGAYRLCSVRAAFE